MLMVKSYRGEVNRAAAQNFCNLAKFYCSIVLKRNY